jgi:hypothetical protein
MTQQQTFTIKNVIRLAAAVSNNQYLLLMAIHGLMIEQGKDWYEAIQGISEKKFLAHLGGLVNSSNFTGEGAAKLLLKLQSKGYVIVEPSRVQVTEKWTAIVEEHGGYLNLGKQTIEEARASSDKKLLDELDALLLEVMQPRTQNFEYYKKRFKKLVSRGQQARNRGLLNDEWHKRLAHLEGVQKSDLSLRPFFNDRLRANTKPPDEKKPPDKPTTEGGDYTNANVLLKVKELSTWKIYATMTNTEFVNNCRDTCYWFDLARKRRLELTDAEVNRLNWVMKMLVKDAQSKKVFLSDFGKNHFAARIKALKANNLAPVAPAVAAEMLKAKLVTVKDA